jgi:N-acetylglutamate synthase-like GNAT family acetyltransferase
MGKEAAESNPASFGPARVEDAAAIAALIHRAFAQYRGQIRPEPSALGESAESIRAALEQESVVVARRDGRIIGCVSVQERDAVAYARRLAVEPAERGAGVGRALMAEAERVARSLGFPRLRVETRLAFVENRAFFRSLGFIEGAQHSHPGFAHPTYVELEKILV